MYVERTGDVPPLVTVSNLTATTQNVTLYTGTYNSPLIYDNPNTAVEGNQVGGSFGFTFTDSNGTFYRANATNFPVVSAVTGHAISADEFKGYLVTMLNGQDIVQVFRSATPNAVMGYTYTIQFTGQVVGGNVQNLNPITTSLTHTTTANTANRVGVLCTNPALCSVGTFVVNVGVSVVELEPGAQLQGSFQLRFLGSSTGALPYNAEAAQVESALNNLATVSPSAVKVSRFGPMRTPTTQVFGYVWEITFNSNTWIDPRIDHSTYFDGNWQGPATTWDAVWESGFSKAWGRQVGNQEPIECASSGLYTTKGLLPSDACTVKEKVKGTSPLKGAFTLALDTLNPRHPVINIQKVQVTAPIAFNAFANATESGGDGTSLEERLIAMENVGDVAVTRSDVNRKTGGFTWLITFLRDADRQGGQWGDSCEQKDSFFSLCNSPGNVPSLVFDDYSLIGTCLNSVDITVYTCPLGLVMTGDSAPSVEPGGSREKQQIYLSNPNFDSNFTLGNRHFSLSFNGVVTSNISVQASAATVQATIESDIPMLAAGGSKRGIIVTEALDPVRAPNGKVFTISYIDEGDMPQMYANASVPLGLSVDDVAWTVWTTTVSDGKVYGLTAAAAGVVNGVVQRGEFTSFFVSDETYVPSSIRWNALPEEVSPFSNVSIKSQLEGISGHKVNVTRLVIGKYGVVQYEVRFIFNPGFFPPGAGDIPILNVTQGAASDGVVYEPQVYEVVKGSNGISGTFDIDLHNDVGPRTVNFNEGASRFGKKLEEMASVGVVFVQRSEYPSPISGGWGENLVDDGTLGGYQWRVFFRKNPGVSDGYSFPPGSGNIDPISVSSDPSELFGTQVSVSVTTQQDGSNPLDGTFTLAYNGSTTDPIAFDQQPLEMKYLLESLDSIGQVSVASKSRLMHKLDGVLVSIARDFDSLTVEYDSIDSDIRQLIAPGDVIKIGGSSGSSFDGSELFSLCAVTPESPVLTVLGTSAPSLLPGERVRIGFDDYSVVRTGVEVQALSVTCQSTSARCGDIQMSFYHNGILSVLPVIVGTSANMTSAATLQSFFDALSTVNAGDVVVTRIDSYDGLSFLYKFYFEGASVLGNVNPLQPNGTCSQCSYSHITLVQGGYTEVQRLRINVDSGYLVGPFVSLSTVDSAVTYSTACIDYGAPASVLASALQALSVYNNRVLAFTATVASAKAVHTSSSLFGLIGVGDRITIGANTTETYVVSAIHNGTFFSVTSAIFSAVGTSGLAVGLVVEDSVRVARSGTGNSTAETIKITTTADSYIQSGAGGYYKLKLTFRGLERRTSCIDFHATAADVASAIDAMGFDFNGDGVVDVADVGHVTVLREGDGTAVFGYGYVYFLRFTGPSLAFGRSDLLGASRPSVAVVDEGHYGSCNDLSGTPSSSILVDAVLSAGKYNWTTFGGLTTEGILQPGDRVRVPDSLSPNQTFAITATGFDAGSTVFLVDGILLTTSTTFVTVFVYSSGIPSFTVEHKQTGEDSYTYDIYMTGPHLSDAPLLVPTVCSGFLHVDGMRYGVGAESVQDGGSQEVQSIAMSSTVAAISNATGYYWKLVAFGVGAVSVVPASNGFPWGIDSDLLQQSLSPLGLNISVTRSGTGSAEENYGFKYSLVYPALLGNLKPVQVLLNGEISVPLFVPGGSTEPSEYVNDLRVSGVFTGAADTVFYVIVKAATTSSNITRDTVQWYTSRNATLSDDMQIYASVAYPLTTGVSVLFSYSSGHSVGDLWQFVGVVTNNSLPSGASILYSTTRDGGPRLNQVTLSQGYAGQALSSVAVYKSSPVFTVASQETTTYELLTQNASSFAFASTYSGALNISQTSTCVEWDDDDFVIEAVLNTMYAGACVGTDDCVVVTRGVDGIRNAGGFQYRIYFASPSFAINFVDTLSVTAGSCSGFVSANSILARVQSGSQHKHLGLTTIPLAAATDSTERAFFRGVALDRVSVFKVSGYDWGVTFDTNIGDLPPLAVTPTVFLSQGTQLLAYDDVVRGEHPLSHSLDDVKTGINYAVRVRAYTRGAYHGYSAYSSPPAITAPASVPDAVEAFSSSPVLNTFEVQQIVVAASHVRQVQEIRTSAAQYAEQQLVTLSVPVGGAPLAGGFALRFPDIQTIQIKAQAALNVTGSYQIVYSFLDFDLFGPVIQTQTTSACIPVDADAEVVKVALESLASIDKVTVDKSGYGGYTSFFGYSYSIAFVGNAVAGRTLPLQVITGGAGCSSASALAGVSFEVSSASEWDAVGTDTEIQSIAVVSDRQIAQGHYRLSFEYPLTNVQTSACVAWNATAAEVKTALEGLSNVDRVYVDRTGSGDSQSSFGYAYSVYFTGNAMHKRDKTTPLGVLHAVSGPGTCVGLDFAAFGSNGVLAYMASDSFSINSTVVQRRGFNLDAATSDSAYLETAMGLLPSYIKISDTSRSLSADGFGYIYTIVFEELMGDVPTFACGVDAALDSISGVCAPSTIIDGNFLRGYFIVGTSNILAADISAADMQAELNRLPDIGIVAVSRTGPSYQGGYAWRVTFLTASGSIDPFRVSNLLTGSNAMVSATTVQALNQISGNYTLSFNGYASSAIPFDATPSLLASILQQPSVTVGSVLVSRLERTSEGGSVYLVTFTKSPKKLPLLVPSYSSMSGAGAVVKVLRSVQGSVAEGDALFLSYESPLYCSHSEVMKGRCGAPIIGYSIDISTSLGTRVKTVLVNETFDVQIVRTAAPSLFDVYVQTDRRVTGYFQLTYNGEVSSPINAQASATDLRDVIEALPSIHAVKVTRDFSSHKTGSVVRVTPGDQTVICVAATCDFSTLPPGELISIDGSWYRILDSYRGSGKVLPLALASDASIPAYFTGLASSSAVLRRWARGYEWTVTFLSASGPSIEQLGSLEHGLNPPDSSVAVRSPPCLKCAMVTDLEAFVNYGLSIRAYNSFGLGAGVSIIGSPKEIPGAPSSITVTGNTGTSLLVTFTMPSIANQQILGYVIQWDSTPLFTQASSLLASCSSAGFGQCVLTGSAILSNPIEYVIQNLQLGVTYYIRVAAINVLSSSGGASSNMTFVENTNWSDVVSYTVRLLLYAYHTLFTLPVDVKSASRSSCASGHRS